MNEAAQLPDQPTQALPVREGLQKPSPLLPFRVRLQILLIISLLLAIILLRLLPQDRGFQNFLVSLRNNIAPSPSPASYMDPNDPVLQQKFPSVVHKVSRSAPNRIDRPFLLVPVGDCASCINLDIKSWVENAKLVGIDVVLMSQAEEKETQEFIRNLQLPLNAIRDSDKHISNQLNVTWIPRPYLFAANGELLWYSRSRVMHYNPFSDQDFQSALKSVQ